MRAQQALAPHQQQDALFRLLVENVQGYAIFLMGPDGEIQTWNEGAQRILGYTAAEIIGSDHSLLYPPSEMRRGKPEYVIRAATEEGKFEEDNWRARRDGTRFWAHVVITSLIDSRGELIGFAKVIHDLSERRQAEEDRNVLLTMERASRTRTEALLKQLEAIQSVTEAALAHLDLGQLLEAILDRLADVLEVDTVAILLITEDGKWLVPRAAKGLEEEVRAGIHLPLGRGFAGRIASERRPIVLNDVEHSEVLNPILRDKGIRSLIGVPLLVEGRVLGVLHVGSLHARHFTEDETSFLQIAADRVAMAIDHARLYAAAERAREEAESAGQEVRLRDEFLSVAAHELRTPIAGLRTAVAVIGRAITRGDAFPRDRLLHMIDLVDRESEKLGRLISRLLDIARLEDGKIALELAEVDLCEIVSAVVERLLTQTLTAQITFECDGPLLIVADALRIDQVLVNLLDNAVKYSPAGGEINVACTRPTDDFAEISVRDHGIGLAVPERERVFERFYQVDATERSTGLGLGLYITREIVERHGGRIWAESPLDGGTRFVVQLPTQASE